MFSKANLPAGTHSRYTTGSILGSTNFCNNPMLLHSGKHRARGSIHDHNTVNSLLA
jgi:hypothetical protein